MCTDVQGRTGKLQALISELLHKLLGYAETFKNCLGRAL